RQDQNAPVKMRRKTSLYAASVHFRWYRFRRLALLRSMPLNNAPNSCTVICNRASVRPGGTRCVSAHRPHPCDCGRCAWHRADASAEPLIMNGFPAGPHKVLIELVNPNHQPLDKGLVTFVIPKGIEPGSHH
ncbi:MAG TPA: DUF6130 family protein, partial [Edaphobacter sp.]|nr:DUF6130 family protein [Edaphobacter sp.]